MIGRVINRKQKEKAVQREIENRWLRCDKQNEIANDIGHSKGYVSEIADKFRESINGDAELFRNFDPQLYTVWNFGKLTNETRVFGSVPQEILDNLLYYYTDPFDVIFDPFAGGGMTIDICKKRKRRYYASDLNPIPARATEIREYDITDGLPDDLPVPNLAFLDPPYWAQAAGKYSEKDSDLGNMELGQFLETIADITKELKRKWYSKPGARLAIIIGTYKQDGQYLDLPLLCYETIVKYLDLKVRVQVPYSTQIHGGNYVKMAKEEKELLYLSRDLMVFGRE